MKEIGGYWMYKIVDGKVERTRPTQQQIIEAEKAGAKNKKKVK